MRMKSTLIVIAVALASGLLVASGALAQQGWEHRQIDVMGPGYANPDLRSAISGGQAESEAFLPETGEMVPAASRHQIDVMGPEYTNPGLHSATSGGEAELELAPAASGNKIDVMGPDYR